MKLENVVIIAHNDNWYCKKCKRAHGELYIASRDFTYCEQCVPEEMKKVAMRINQNREKI